MIVSPHTGASEATPANSTCHHCGTDVVQSTRLGGRVKRFCSARCRKALSRALNDQETSMKAARHRASLARADPGVALAPKPGRFGAEAPARQSKRDNPSLPISAGHEVSGQVLLGTTQSLLHPPLEEPSQEPSVWAVETFVAPIDRSFGVDRTDASYRLRQGLRMITEVERCKRCGRDILGGSVALVDNAGVGHFSGVETCGRVWLCPVCSGKIRARRGDDIAEGVGRWLVQGGAALFLTATLPHDQGDALATTLELLTRGWKAIWSGKASLVDRKRYGSIGNIKSIEITHGAAGWHPHIHAVVVLEQQLDLYTWCEWARRLQTRWDSFLLKEGWRPSKVGVGIKVLPVEAATAAQLAAYVTKIQDGKGGKGLGNEIARADLKRGRFESRTPTEILRDFLTWGDVEDLDRWYEYERATAGKSAIRWSPRLRAQLLPEAPVEESDDAIAAEEVGGNVIGHVLPRTWYRICEIPGAEAAVKAAIGYGGMEAVVKTLLSYRLDVGDVFTPEEWKAQDST